MPGQLGPNRFQVEGDIGHLPETEGLDVRFEAAGPELAPFATVAELKALPAEPFEVRGRLSIHDGEDSTMKTRFAPCAPVLMTAFRE